MDLLKRIGLPLLMLCITLPLLMLCITIHSNAVANQTLIRTKTRLEGAKSGTGGEVFAFSPDGKMIAGGTGVVSVSSGNRKSQQGGDVLLWNARSGKLLRSLGQHGDSVWWVAFSQDGGTLVSASRGDGTIKVWQMPAGRLRHTLKIDAEARTTDLRWPQLTLSGDGRTLVTINSGGEPRRTGGELIVWDVDSGKKRWSKADSGLHTATPMADGRGMVGVLNKFTDVGKDNQGRTRFRREVALQSWNAETGDVLVSVDLGNMRPPDTVALLDGDKTVALFTSGGLLLCDRLTGEVKHRIAWHKDRSSFGRSFLSADGKTVGRTALRWLELVDVATGQSRGLLITELRNSIGYVYFSADLKRAVNPYDRDHSGSPVILDLVHAAVALPKTDGPDLPKSQRRDAAQQPKQPSQRRDVAQWPKHLATLSGHGGTVTSAAFSPDGKLLATGGTGRGSGQLKLWDLSTGKPVWQKNVHTSHVRGVAYSPDGRTVATASYDGTIGLWDAAGGEQLDTLTGHENWVNAVAFSPDGRYLISAGRDTNACLWQIHPQGSQRAQLATTLRGHEMWVMAVAFSADATKWASASADPANGAKPGRIIVSNPPGQMKHESQLELTTGGFALAFSSDSKTIAVGGNGEITIYDARTNKVVRTWKAHNGKVNAVVFSHDDKVLASGSSDKSVKLWDAKTGKLVNKIDAHRSQVYAVAFSPDGKRLVTTSRDRTARLWDVEGYGQQSVRIDSAEAIDDRMMKLGPLDLVIANLSVSGVVVDVDSYKSDMRTNVVEAANPDDLVGEWTLSVDLSGVPQLAKLNVIETGPIPKAKLTSTFGEADVRSIAREGENYLVSYDVEFGEERLDVKLSLTLENDTLSGNVATGIGEMAMEWPVSGARVGTSAESDLRTVVETMASRMENEIAVTGPTLPVGDAEEYLGSWLLDISWVDKVGKGSSDAELLVVEDEGKVVAGLVFPGKPLDIFYEISKSEKGLSWPIDLRFGDVTIKLTMEISLEDERLVGTWEDKDEIVFVLSGVKRPAGEMSSISEDLLRQKPNVELVGVIADPARVVDVKDHEVYVQEGTDLTILNVTNPLLVRFKLCNLQERSHAVWVMDSTVYAFKRTPSAVAAEGSLVFAADTQQLHIIDISEPSTPTLLTSYDTPRSSRTYDIAVSGSNAIVAAAGGLRIIDVSKPRTPALLSTFKGRARWNRGVDISGSMVYIATSMATGASWLQIVDISDPSAPTQVGICRTPGVAQDVAVLGTLAYVADREAGLEVIDVSDPANPIGAGFYRTRMYASKVAVSEQLTFMSLQKKGLTILKYDSRN